MVNLRLIKVNPKDYEFMKNEFRQAFIKKNPEFEGMHMSNNFLFHKIIQTIQEVMIK